MDHGSLRGDYTDPCPFASEAVAAADLADERPVDPPVQRFHSDGLFLTQYGGWKNHRGQRVRTSELFKDKRGSEARNI